MITLITLGLFCLAGVVLIPLVLLPIGLPLLMLLGLVPWLLRIAGVVLLNAVNFDYAMTGLILMLIFYLCRNKPLLGAVLYTLSYLPALWGGSPEDPLALRIGGLAIGFEIFALLALPFIEIHTHVEPKIPKWFFYLYYPAHLLAIYLLQLFL